MRVWYLGSGLPVTPILTTGLAATRSSPDTELVAEHRHRPWGAASIVPSMAFGNLKYEDDKCSKKCPI